MDKRVLIVAGILIVVVGVVLFARSHRTPPPGAKDQAKPFPELQAERPKGDAKWVHPAIQKIDRLEVTKGGATLEIQRTKAGDGRRSFGDWEIVKPYKYRADEYAVRQVIQRATTLRFWEPASQSKGDHGAMEVDDAKGLRIALFEKQRKIAEFYLGKEIRTELNERPMTYTYFRAAGEDTVWKIIGSLKLLTQKEANAWRDPKILHLKRDDLTALSITSPAGTIALTRDANEKDPKKRNSNWVLKSSEPPIPAVEASDVSRIASTLSYLRTQEFVDQPKSADTGLDKPGFQVTVATKDKQSHTLLMGKTTEREVTRGKRKTKEKLVYVQVKGNPQVFLIQENRVSALMKTPQELRDRSVVRLTDGQKVKRLEVYIKDGPIILAHDGKTWKVEQPAGMAFDAKALDRDLKMLYGRFTAKELAKETDPAKTGLDKPQGRLVLTVETPTAPAAAPKKDPKQAKAPTAPPGKVEVIELLVGKEAAKREYYVQVKGKPDVFVLRQYTLERLWKAKGKWNPPKRPPGRGMPPGFGGRGGRGMPPGFRR